MIQLKVQVPGEIYLDEPVRKIIAESEDGYFCIKPRHIDFVTSLAAGIASFIDENDKQRFIACDGGILVKCGNELLISTFNAVTGDSLQTLEEIVDTFSARKIEDEMISRSAATRLEASIVRKFVEMDKLR
jgi:F-type H+-transporting ATPase subunit epsilon